MGRRAKVGVADPQPAGLLSSATGVVTQDWDTVTEHDSAAPSFELHKMHAHTLNCLAALCARALSVLRNAHCSLLPPLQRNVLWTSPQEIVGLLQAQARGPAVADTINDPQGRRHAGGSGGDARSCITEQAFSPT